MMPFWKQHFSKRGFLKWFSRIFSINLQSQMDLKIWSVGWCCCSRSSEKKRRSIMVKMISIDTGMVVVIFIRQVHVKYSGNKIFTQTQPQPDVHGACLWSSLLREERLVRPALQKLHGWCRFQNCYTFSKLLFSNLLFSNLWWTRNFRPKRQPFRKTWSVVQGFIPRWNIQGHFR